MKRIALIIIFSFTFLSISAQNESFRQSFLEANTLMEENQYNLALPIWLKLTTEQPENSNVNYKVGVCYIKSSSEKSKALNYLVKASQNTTKNYDPFSSSEKKAPVESYFYLAKAYHINYKLDEAIASYNSFKEKISTKHYLFNEVDHNIEQCENAKIAMKNPVNIEVHNMGEFINSPFGDYSPVLSLDESTMYFTSRRMRKDSSNYYIKDISDGKHYEDIYVSENYDGAWTEPKLLVINTEGHEATVNLSTDGQTLFIFKDDDGDGNIYTSKLDGENWSAPVKLGSDINLRSRETHAHISPDENSLYFVSDRKKGLGGQDIYLCKKLPTGEWAKAQNLGSAINTVYDEDGVFIHPDGKTMYFSSKGHSSIGGYDIFYSVLDSAGNWSKPVNMGYPINSTDDDVFFVTSADGTRGYYSSFQEIGYGEKDIYQIVLKDAPAKPLTLLSGRIKVIGEPELPDNAQVVVNDNKTGELVGIYKPRKKDGKFSLILSPGNDYHIIYSASIYKKEEDLYIPPVSAYQEINRGIDLEDVIFGATDSVIVDKILDENSSESISANNTNPNDNDSNLTDNTATTTSTPIDDTTTNNNSSTTIDEIKDRAATPITKIVDTDTKKTENNNVIADYQEHFNYNIKSLNTTKIEYIEMIDKVVSVASKKEKVSIEIESSASHVPTKTFKTNINLSSLRGDEAKEVILNSLKEKGISTDKINVTKINSIVRGPKYIGDYKNTKKYRPFQYIKVTIR